MYLQELRSKLASKLNCFVPFLTSAFEVFYFLLVDLQALPALLIPSTHIAAAPGTISKIFTVSPFHYPRISRK